jgi:cyclic pyranopterin phosphate synthase
MPREHFGSGHEFLGREALLTYEEITTVVEALLSSGLEKVRITGGEPLLRRDLVKLIEMLRTTAPDIDLALTTNGVLLNRYAEALREAGLDRVTVSLDAVEPSVFATMADTEQFGPADVLAGIRAAQDAGLGVKVNTVVRKGVNEHQIFKLADACMELQVPLRFIEFMDVGNTNAWNIEEVLTGEEIRQRVERHVGLLLPKSGQKRSAVARSWVTANGHEFGFINSVSEPFCGDCTRARLSANGSLYTCLFAATGHDLKAMLRMSATKSDILNAVNSIWTKRKDRYSAERTFSEAPQEKVEMSFIGG